MTDDQGPDSPSERPPSFANLADWVDGRLTRGDASEMERRVRRAGTEAAEAVAWLKGFVRFGRRNPLPAPPPVVRQRLRQSFERHHGRSPEVIRLTAALSFDSRDDVVLSGVRGGFEIDEGYHLAFAADSFGVLVDVLPNEAGNGPGRATATVRLDGQVLTANPDAPVWSAVIEHPGGTMTDIGGDADGCFAIEGVPIDAKRLLLSNGLTEIEIIQPLGDPGS
ncbi:MAG: hypothetical protein WBM50_23145 [Acidimicrobiales bacterium]